MASASQHGHDHVIVASDVAGKRQCALFLARKGRNCRMQAAKDSLYCGEHLTLDKQIATARRIPCPLDSSHSVFEHLLDKHLKKCNAAKKPIPSCYVKNINSGLIDYSKSLEEQLPLNEFSSERIEDLIMRINQAYEECQEEIESIFHSHHVVADEITSSKNGPSAHKHLLQQASILGHMESANLLSSDTCYVEFGAGRGKLSHWLQLAMSNENNCHYVLVDRASSRRKMDLYHRFEEQGPKFERLLIDIEHLDLCCLDSVCSGRYSDIVGVSKHLCGSATDLALRCLVRLRKFHKASPLQASSPAPSLETSSECRTPLSPCVPLVKGIIIALCCHHCCDWKQFVGQEFFAKRGFTPIDFYLLTHMSSWGVCGVRPGDKIHTQEQTASVDTISPQIAATSTVSESSSSTSNIFSTNSSFASSNGTVFPSRIPSTYIPHPKEKIGLKCKRLLDIARLEFLRAHGFTTKLVYYVDRSVSLENVLLLAIPQLSQ